MLVLENNFCYVPGRSGIAYLLHMIWGERSNGRLLYFSLVRTAVRTKLSCSTLVVSVINCTVLRVLLQQAEINPRQGDCGRERFCSQILLELSRAFINSGRKTSYKRKNSVDQRFRCGIDAERRLMAQTRRYFCYCYYSICLWYARIPCIRMEALLFLLSEVRTFGETRAQT